MIPLFTDSQGYIHKDIFYIISYSIQKILIFLKKILMIVMETLNIYVIILIIFYLKKIKLYMICINSEAKDNSEEEIILFTYIYIYVKN